jgi:hypothetical protein
MAKYGRRTLTVVVLTAAVWGCAEMGQPRPDQQQQDAAATHQRCIAKGFTEGTPEFSNCMEAEAALMADRRRRGVYGTGQQPAATYGQPDTGRLCLPTAAGASFGC